MPSPKTGPRSMYKLFTVQLSPEGLPEQKEKFIHQFSAPPKPSQGQLSRLARVRGVTWEPVPQGYVGSGGGTTAYLAERVEIKEKARA